MKITFRPLLVTLALGAFFTSCKKDSDPVIVIQPSSGSTLTLNGLIGNEAGTSAGNSVYVDFSTDVQTAVARASWDLGFYSGSDYRVILNNTTFAIAAVTTKTDLNSVGTTDTVGVTLSFNQSNPPLVSSGIADDPSGDLTKTAIPAISSTDANNKVVIINRGTAGSTAARDFVKVRILRSGSNYTLQYAPLTATTYSTVTIAKSTTNNFTYINLDNGSTVSVAPATKTWDIEWGLSLYKTSFTTGTVFYTFSDLVFINSLDGTQAFQTNYADSTTAANAYTVFNKDSIAKYTFSSERDVIGSNWRVTSGSPLGIRRNRFYIVKDPSGNFYKLKFLAMGVNNDGGTRGKPVIQYELIAQ